MVDSARNLGKGDAEVGRHQAGRVGRCSPQRALVEVHPARHHMCEGRRWRGCLKRKVTDLAHLHEKRASLGVFKSEIMQNWAPFRLLAAASIFPSATFSKEEKNLHSSP